MKVQNLTSTTIYLKDLALTRESQTEARRTENQYLGAGHSVYLPDTSDVIRSAHKGDLYRFSKEGKVALNELVDLAAFPGPGNTATISHGLGYCPNTVIFKKVIVGPIITWKDAAGTVDIVHSEDFTETVLTNTVALPLTFLVKIG